MNGTTSLFVTWNIERRCPSSRQARTMIERIAALSPDVVCLTEAFEGSTAELGGFEISVTGVFWSREAALERKVVLWSRNPWTDVDPLGNQELQTGGFIAAITTTPLGDIRVLGVCIPYHLASPMSVAPRCPAWSQQLLYLSGLRRLIASRTAGLPMVVLGDYNQFVPRIWGSKAASLALSDALNDLSVCTGGKIEVVNRPAIDHMALSPELRPFSVNGIDEHDANGRKLSDHFGVAVRVRAC
ncbi:endonuclease/exonuclease/phosphatase family protein [Mesorhizobium sp. LNJC394B00]|uniref:endonuclease/exonuclease/phosphatase family protein n=1 Tax=Mesorhizobium sp. LNJC394B00 TaxID=1287274 RepID=UPI000A03057F|nr:endonuclease/exonuclease/phosphatase family protein [Mesorhizobium sp. LNJC394B00]